MPGPCRGAQHAIEDERSRWNEERQNDPAPVPFNVIPLVGPVHMDSRIKSENDILF
jgi:hypothetical protein